MGMYCNFKSQIGYRRIEEVREHYPQLPALRTDAGPGVVYLTHRDINAYINLSNQLVRNGFRAHGEVMFSGDYVEPCMEIRIIMLAHQLSEAWHDEKNEAIEEWQKSNPGKCIQENWDEVMEFANGKNLYFA